MKGEAIASKGGVVPGGKDLTNPLGKGGVTERAPDKIRRLEEKRDLKVGRLTMRSGRCPSTPRVITGKLKRRNYWTFKKIRP